LGATIALAVTGSHGHTDQNCRLFAFLWYFLQNIVRPTLKNPHHSPFAKVSYANQTIFYMNMKKLLRYLTFFLMVGSSHAQSNLPACQGADTTLWSNCFGAANWPNGAKYVGEWVNGNANGLGTHTSGDGKWKGDKYVGELKGGKYNGQGTYFYLADNQWKGDIYVGDWKDGKFNSQGTYTYANGNKYVGEHKDGKRDGKGTFFFLASDQWKGDTYVGEYKDEKVTGQGTYTYANGNKYVGEHKDGKRDGQGIFTFANGIKYVGEFKDGKYNGKGTLFALDGTVKSQGIWADNNLVSSAPLQQTTAPNLEIEKLRLETAEAKRKQAEAEEQLRVSRQSAQPTPAVTPSPLLPVLANRRALVIGNDTYKTVGKLDNARQDAKTIAANLTAVGYQVTLKLDLNEREMKTALRTFSEQVQGGDEVMFFFAGHGVQLGAANYLLPTDIGSDSEAQVRDEAIQLQRVLDDMSDRKAKFTLAMIDACRDNPFKTAGRAIGGRGLAPTTAATGQMVIFSAGTGQQALDRLSNSDKNKNGLFTRVFVQEMQKPNQSIDRVVKNVRNQVAAMAKSVGHDQVPAIYDQVLGDFYFKK